MLWMWRLLLYLSDLAHSKHLPDYFMFHKLYLGSWFWTSIFLSIYSGILDHLHGWDMCTDCVLIYRSIKKLSCKWSIPIFKTGQNQKPEQNCYLMAFSIGMFRAKPVYCHTVSMTFDRVGYRYISFALSLPIENAIIFAQLSVGAFFRPMILDPNALWSKNHMTPSLQNLTEVTWQSEITNRKRTSLIPIQWWSAHMMAALVFMLHEATKANVTSRWRNLVKP